VYSALLQNVDKCLDTAPGNACANSVEGSNVHWLRRLSGAAAIVGGHVHALYVGCLVSLRPFALVGNSDVLAMKVMTSCNTTALLVGRNVADGTADIVLVEHKDRTGGARGIAGGENSGDARSTKASSWVPVPLSGSQPVRAIRLSINEVFPYSGDAIVAPPASHVVTSGSISSDSPDSSDSSDSVLSSLLAFIADAAEFLSCERIDVTAGNTQGSGDDDQEHALQDGHDDTISGTGTIPIEDTESPGNADDIEKSDDQRSISNDAGDRTNVPLEVRMARLHASVTTIKAISTLAASPESAAEMLALPTGQPLFRRCWLSLRHQAQAVVCVCLTNSKPSGRSYGKCSATFTTPPSRIPKQVQAPVKIILKHPLID